MFTGHIDVLRRVEFIFDDETLGKTFTEMPVPEAYRERVEAARHEVIEAAVEHDDELLEKYLGRRRAVARARSSAPSGRRRPSRRHRAGAVRRLVQEQGRAGAARRGHRLPAEPDGHPADQGPPPAARRHPRRALRLGQRAVRRAGVQDRHRPLRRPADLLPGVLGHRSRAASYVYNSTKDKRERVGRLLQMHANKREEIEEVLAGDIARGHRPQGHPHRRHAVRRGQADHPRGDEVPRTRSSTSPSSPRPRPTRTSWPSRCRSCQEEDPTFRVRTDAETGQTIIAGMGELHLEILVDRMKREFKVEANVGKPQVAFRETIRKKVKDVEGKFIRQSRRQGPVRPRGDRRRAGRAGRGLRLRGQDRRRRDPAGVHQAGRGRDPEALENGVLAGYPMVDVKADAGLRQLPRRGQLGNGVQDRRLDGVQGGGPAGAARPARAGHGGRGGDARPTSWAT